MSFWQHQNSLKNYYSALQYRPSVFPVVPLQQSTNTKDKTAPVTNLMYTPYGYYPYPVMIPPKDVDAKSSFKNLYNSNNTKKKHSRKISISQSNNGRQQLRRKDSPDSSRGSNSSSLLQQSQENSRRDQRQGRLAASKTKSTYLSRELDNEGVFMPLEMYYYDNTSSKRSKRQRTSD